MEVKQKYLSSKMYFSHLTFLIFTLRAHRRAPDPSLPRVRSKRLRLHPWRLDSEALRRVQNSGTNKGPATFGRNVAGVIVPELGDDRAVDAVDLVGAGNVGRYPQSPCSKGLYGHLHFRIVKELL